MRLSFVVVTLVSISGLVTAIPTKDSIYDRVHDAVQFDSRNEIWGTGRYTLDLNYFHRHVKDSLKAAFSQHYKNFYSMCGTNVDFDIDRKGWQKFPALHLGDTYILPHIQRSPSPEPHHQPHYRRSYVNIFDDLD
ncbi:hypothetical protein D9619_001289 [Psilocybe cf. subviscida]|uniref:Uncharacterized protein n=1 Tax=Psilocybe cf. subviscida TaxID=2480587 RepID=A0A8H5F3U9_9AGAR|nr:hypothetical protein D9619_001289 [Psilocybe cf. subviscida]